MNQLPLLAGGADGKLAVKNSAVAGEKNTASTDGQPFGEMLARQLNPKNTATDKLETLKNNGLVSGVALKANLKEALDEAGAAVFAADDDAAAALGIDLLATLPAALPVGDLSQQLAAADATSRQLSRAGTQREQVEDATLRPAAGDDRSTRNEKTDPALVPFAAAAVAGMAADNRIAAAQMTDSAALATAPQNSAPLLSAATPLPLSAAGPAAAPLQTAVATPLAHAQWADDFGQKITWLATQNQQRAELHLNPPHLGPLDVTLKLNGDQATALFSSPHAAVREAIEQSLPKLREMFADNGIMLGGATVSDQSQREQHSEPGNPPPAGIDIRNAETVGTAGSLNSPRIAQHDGMVDTFA